MTLSRVRLLGVFVCLVVTQDEMQQVPESKRISPRLGKIIGVSYTWERSARYINS